jgi:ankyrin repeat protein
MMISCENGHTAIAAILLKYKANIEAVHQVDAGHRTLKLFEKRVFHPFCSTDCSLTLKFPTYSILENGKRALMYACENGHSSTVAMLLDNKARIEATDKVK